MSSRRKIVVDDVEYTWQVGSSCVVIRGPNKYKKIISKPEATGFYSADRDFEKKNARITPGMIAEYIKMNP